MGQAFANFIFERLMSSFQFRKVRLHRHASMSPQSVALHDLSLAQTHHKCDGTPIMILRQIGPNL